jgi:hypothetical protein
MTGTVFLFLALLIAIFVVTVVVPGGVFVAPVLLLMLIGYGIYRYAQTRRGVV